MGGLTSRSIAMRRQWVSFITSIVFSLMLVSCIQSGPVLPYPNIEDLGVSDNGMTALSEVRVDPDEVSYYNNEAYALIAIATPSVSKEKFLNLVYCKASKVMIEKGYQDWELLRRAVFPSDDVFDNKNISQILIRLHRSSNVNGMMKENKDWCAGLKK
jgi:hypothetical protein